MVTYVDGTLKKKLLDAAEWIVAAKDTTVVSGDKFRTLHNSRAELELKELDILRLAPGTTIDIVKLYEETKELKDQTKIDVEEGDIWAMVGGVNENASFDLFTPVAGVAITGTVFRISVDEDSTTELKVYKGEVLITNAPENKNLQPQSLPVKQPQKISGTKQISGPRQITLEEWRYIVGNMEAVKINRYGEVISSGKFSKDDQDEESDWVKWNLERDALMMKKD